MQKSDENEKDAQLLFYVIFFHKKKIEKYSNEFFRCPVRRVYFNLTPLLVRDDIKH